jgi:hypothetical protein
MVAVITGDIINSREVEARLWLKELREELSLVGQEWTDWEIYRGDSFQLMLTPNLALQTAIFIKARIKQFKELDVRIGIGLGDVDHRAERVSESNGTAFVYAGECFDKLKKETLAIKSPSKKFDRVLNLMFSLAGLTMDYWTPVSSELILNSLRHPELNQKEIADQLDRKSQGTISEGLKRGGFQEIQKLLLYYNEEIDQLCSS